MENTANNLVIRVVRHLQILQTTWTFQRHNCSTNKLTTIYDFNVLYVLWLYSTLYTDVMNMHMHTAEHHTTIRFNGSMLKESGQCFDLYVPYSSVYIVCILHPPTTIYDLILIYRISYHRASVYNFRLQSVCVISKMNLVHVWGKTFRINVISFCAYLRNRNWMCIVCMHSSKYIENEEKKYEQFLNRLPPIHPLHISYFLHRFRVYGFLLHFILCALSNILLFVFPLFVFYFEKKISFQFIFFTPCLTVLGGRFCIVHNILNTETTTKKMHS